MSRNYRGAEVIERFGRDYGWEPYGSHSPFATSLVLNLHGRKSARITFTHNGRVKSFHMGGTRIPNATRRDVLDHLRREGVFVR